MGVSVSEIGNVLYAEAGPIVSKKIVLAYPSVGATENIMMFAAMAKGNTRIVNAALEPEVLDLIVVLKKMGAKISIEAPSVIEIEGVSELFPVEHAIIYDRLEAGALLVATAMTGGHISIPQAPAFAMEVFLQKLTDMGHALVVGNNDVGVELWATKTPKAVSIKTGPHPQFPTDMQALMTVALCVADGVSVIEETVFENRLMHMHELRKMGANIKIIHDQKAVITGVDRLYGSSVIAPDIRASCALVLAGLVAQGRTVMAGVNHFKRAYDALDVKLNSLGASVYYAQEPLL
jgi:UDP-N-acetylglucosamine 1-carboxyvinyltransferase